LKHTIFLDVTQLVEWKGNLTGIPRTTDEIAVRLKEQENTEFIKWNFEADLFEKVDIEDYYANIAPKNRDYFKNHKKTAPQIAGLTPIEIAKKIVRRSRTLSRSVEIAKSAKRRTLRRYKDTQRTKLRLQIGSSDILFIPCGLWDNDGYIETVTAYKQHGAKLVFLSYDILPIVVPQFSGQWGKPMKQFTRLVTSASDLIFSISKHTKKDLSEFLASENLPIPEIVTIRLGDAFNDNNPIPPSDFRFIKTGILETKEDYIFCAGTLEARKNHTILYYTYKLAKSHGLTLPKLIIAGRPGYRTDDIVDIIEEDPEVNRDIIILKDVSDGELSWLYKHCRFTIYPSFYEGWGLPIAESVAQGIPCIASNTSSMIEVAPGIAGYFNPTSTDECLTRILEYMDDRKFKRAQDDTKKYKMVSWDETFNDITEALTRLDKKGA